MLANRDISLPEHFDISLRDILSSYSNATSEQVEAICAETMAELVQRSIEAAPVGRAGTGPHFFQSIASRKQRSTMYGSSFLWYVRAPNHSITHLIAKAHQSKAGRVVNPSFDLAGLVDNAVHSFENALRRMLHE